MDSVPVMSSNNVCSVKNGGNLWGSKHSTENVYYASSSSSKAAQHRRKIQIKYNSLRFQQPSLNHHYIEGGLIHQECKKKYIVKAVSRPSFDVEPATSHPKITLDSVRSFFITLYQFFYPQSMIGQTLMAFSASLLAVEKLSDLSPLFFTSMIQAQVPFLFMLIYVNGVNQLADIEIDKINKPHLPLPSGRLSYTAAVIITGSSLILSFLLSWIIGSWPLIWALVLSCILWTGYSIDVPLLRWKKHPLFTAICTCFTMAFICPVSFFLHMQTFVLKNPLVFSRSLISYVVFMSFYSVGMALFKDIPDIEGDKKFGIDSFSARLGQKRIFWICIWLLEMAFGVAIVAGVTSSYLWLKIPAVLGHTILASVLWYRTKYVDLINNASTLSFYMFVWKLLSVACFLLPLIK